MVKATYCTLLLDFKYRQFYKRIGGVYMIEIGDWVYIGQSKHIERRWKQWRHLIRMNNYLPDTFVVALNKCTLVRFAIIEEVTKAKQLKDIYILNKRERHWYCKYKSEGRKLLNGKELIPLPAFIWDIMPTN